MVEIGQLLIVERWECSHYFFEQVECAETVTRKNYTLAMSAVHGPLLVDYPRLTGVVKGVNVSLEYAKEHQLLPRADRANNVLNGEGYY